MTGALHQLRLDFVPVEDRMLLRISTHDQTEVRMWLTRRFVKGLWQALVKVAEADPSARQVVDAEAKQAVIAFQHEKAVKDETFGQPFKETATEFPLGQAPTLVTGLKIGAQKKGEPPRIAFQTADKKSISLGLDDQILHSFMRLITQVLKQAEWDLAIELPGTAAAASDEPATPVRVH